MHYYICFVSHLIKEVVRIPRPIHVCRSFLETNSLVTVYEIGHRVLHNKFCFLTFRSEVEQHEVVQGKAERCSCGMQFPPDSRNGHVGAGD